MKKLLLGLFAAAFAVSIIGCSNSSGGDSPAETTTPVTPAEPPYVAQETPLTLEAIAAGTITLTNPWSTLKYKKNGGDFVNVTASANTIAVAAGDKVAFYADGSENTYTCDSSTNMITVTALRISCSSDCYVYGNVMSLLSSSNFKNAVSISKEYAFAELFYENTHIKNHAQKALVLPATTLADSCYYSMFQGCTGLTSAPALPATTLADYCYFLMFQGCTGLTSAPALPATTLADYCYNSMFDGCTGLTSAPALPATTLADSCYSSMFYGCTGLASAPALPATTLADYCYSFMFKGCTSLTSAPALPATTLTSGCYASMFYGCTSLTSAPALPATTLVEWCYDSMFYGCTSLSSVTCLATNNSADSCTVNWLGGVASSGTFTKAASMTTRNINTSGTAWILNSSSGIPSGWTVVDYQEQ